MRFLDNIADKIINKRQTEPGYIAKWFVYYQAYPVLTYFQVKCLKWRLRRFEKKGEAMKYDEIRVIVEWIWKKAGLDKDDESWQGMMFEDAIKAIRKMLSV